MCFRSMELETLYMQDRDVGRPFSFGVTDNHFHLLCGCDDATTRTYLLFLEDTCATAVPLVDGQTHVQYEHVARVEVGLGGWYLQSPSILQLAICLLGRGGSVRGPGGRCPVYKASRSPSHAKCINARDL